MQVRTPTHPAAPAALKTTVAGLLLAALAACGGGGGTDAAASTAAASGAGPAGTSSSTSTMGAPATSGTTAPGGGTAPASSTATPTAVALQRTDFQVNTTTAGDQDSAQLARLAGGGFVAVWTSDAVSAATNVRLQRYDAQLRPVGGETAVAAGFSPAVAALPDGGFVVTWTASPYTYEANGWARRYDAQGAPAGGAVQLAATFYKYVTRVLGLADGSYVVAADTVAGKYGAEFATLTRYGADGSALGTPVRLTSSLDAVTSAIDTNRVFDLTATALADGRFVAAWIAAGRAQSELRVALFDGTAAQQGAFATIAAESGLQSPSLATLANGNYVLAWQAGAEPGAKTAYVEIFEPSGRSLGRHVVATDASSSLLQPRVAATADGGFVVAWRATRYGSTALERQALAQRFTAAGAPAGAAETLGQVSVPSAGRSNFADSLAVAGGAAGDGYLVLHGGFGASGGWEVLGASR
jgi:hypothetical protein